MICGFCHQFVPINTFHQCQQPNTQVQNVDQRIALALESIAASLEAIAHPLVYKDPEPPP